VLRTLDDATKLNAAMKASKQAVVLGAGLVGMHAAENLVKAGASVTIVEMSKQLTSGYFDEVAAGMIEKAFTRQRREDPDRHRVVGSSRPAPHGATLTLDNGDTIPSRPAAGRGRRAARTSDYLDGSGVEHRARHPGRRHMQTSVRTSGPPATVPRRKGFYTDTPVMNAILPDATEQGRIAGMAMAERPGLKPYPGGVPLNTYHFFGRHAISVGSAARCPRAARREVRFDEASGRYLRAMFDRDERLTGIYGVNEFFDAGVMCQLILRRTDLGPLRERFFAEPLATGRELMSKLWS
jgi:phenylglyoxylate dehydrogenase epsilon subunit